MAEQALKPLIVFELANNHNGSVGLGVEIIEEFSKAADAFRDDFRFGFKMQYRDLDTYIHPTALRDGYVKRFLDTRLSRAEQKILANVIRENGFEAVCTPFDETSVANALEDGFATLKIASACLGDWPLMEAIAGTGLPVIASTGGANEETIWKVCAFFRHRDIPLALLHCVAEYPTRNARLNLRRIESLKKLHPELKVGFSTHESPETTESLGLALALGAEVIEKHVGLPPLNAYSASPDHVQKWLKAGSFALAMLGRGDHQTSRTEQDSLSSLRRGVYAKRKIDKGHTLSNPDVSFAFPAAQGQLSANEWSKYTMYETNLPLNEGERIHRAQVDAHDMNDKLHAIARSVFELVTESGVVIPDKSALEISHHYGLSEFERTGLAMFTLVNREYCKKILLLLPGQRHPEQYHMKKEETFVLLHGEMSLFLDGEMRRVKRGDVVTITPGVRHAFTTKDGAVFEEISTAHDPNDSFYTDERINGNTHRKTFITHWVNA